MSLLINGCSFAHFWNPSEDFVKYLQCKDVVNLGKPGTGFDRTVRTTIEWIATNGKPDFVLIPITLSTRWELSIAKTEKDIADVARELNMSSNDIKSRIIELHEQNPMLGHRGCRLGISFPEIYQMQCKAIFEALVECKRKKIKSVIPEIMIPLVSTEAEIKIMKELVIRVAKEVQKENKIKIKFLVGTMIELPRAAIKAKDIAKHAEFFSFGTNDLTQTTFGISRDDSGKFLNDYIENKIFDIDPFVSIDDGVGDLIEIAVSKGKKQNKKIKLGICGEHGGDPKSINFCSKTGLDYVSCSPYRVPIARLAAAQAELKKD